VADIGKGIEIRPTNGEIKGIEIRPTNGERNKFFCSFGVKPLIHQSELGTYMKVVPFQEKSFFLRKTPTLKIAWSSSRNSVFIGHASNPP
jgi:hypothetical protein